MPAPSASPPSASPPTPPAIARRPLLPWERLRRASVRLSVMAVLPLFSVLGCGGGAPADVTLLWRLVDGRSCVDTAIIRTVAEIEGQTPPTIYESRCSQRPENNRLQLPAVAPSAHILLRAETLNKLPIYRGEVRIANPVPPVIETELYYTGGQ